MFEQPYNNILLVNPSPDLFSLLQIIMLGIVGECVARMYEETKRLSNNIVDDVVKFRTLDSEELYG